ncbi:hypothetical protein EON63_03880, partial [archaeon]
MFSSKTKLFKHLIVHGYESNSLKPSKVVLLVGWLSSVVDDEDKWISDQTWNSHLGDKTSSVVEQAVFKAVYVVENGLESIDQIPNGGQEAVLDRLKGFSRGGSVLQRTSVLFSTEPTCHSLCDTFCFQTRPLGLKPIQTFVSELNKYLPDDIYIHHGYLLSNEAGSSFHAETECTQRRYEYLMPLHIIMPTAFITPPAQQVTRLSNFRNNANNPARSPMDLHFPISTDDGQMRISYFRKLKEIFRVLTGDGRKDVHNYVTAGATPGMDTCYRKVDRIYHKSLFRLSSDGSDEGDSWVLLSVSGDTLLRGQVRRLLGMTLAVALDFLPLDYCKASFSSDMIDVPALPGRALYLAECKYSNWEAKFTDFRLDPRRSASTSTIKLHDEIEQLGLESPVMLAWQTRLHQHIARSCRDVFNADFIEQFRAQCVEKLTKLTVLQSLKNRLRSSMVEEFVQKFGVTDTSCLEEVVVMVVDEDTNATTTADENAHGSADSPILADNGSSESAQEEQPVVPAKHSVRETEAYKKHKELLTFITIPITHDDCPAVYREVLRLLRQADRSGLWPSSSTGRQQVIMPQTLLEQGGRGGSFSVGALPAHLPQPKGNTLFPELVYASFTLERMLLPSRPPSGMIAINRHAAFLPHRDSGVGAGQSTSLIVGLGGYMGGEVVVEGVGHDIRYKPLEFDGWMDIHHTLPFLGERYSLVWFTPLGVGVEDSEDALPDLA